MKMTMMIILIFWFQIITAPPNGAGVIFESEGINPFENLYKAVCRVESGGNPFAVGDKHLKNWSYGIVQIRKTRLDDFCNRTGIRYSTADMFDTVKSKQVFMYYASQYKPHEVESVSRAWNAGPRWRNVKQSKDYWWKVQKFLKRYENQRKTLK